MAKDCCWNCKHYIVKGDNEPAILSGAISNVCVFNDEKEDVEKPSGQNIGWVERASPTPANYVCRHYRERFY